jgi:hypothetical protein
MLKDTTGVGFRVSEVKEDIVIARGMDLFWWLSLGGEVDVRTTTGCVSRRISARNCSERARCELCGWTEGGWGGANWKVRGA